MKIKSSLLISLISLFMSDYALAQDVLCPKTFTCPTSNAWDCTFDPPSTVTWMVNTSFKPGTTYTFSQAISPLFPSAIQCVYAGTSQIISNYQPVYMIADTKASPAWIESNGWYWCATGSIGDCPFQIVSPSQQQAKTPK